MPQTLEQKRAKNRERQARFKENHAHEEQVLRERHRAVARRSYYKKRLREPGEKTVAEMRIIKQATLKPSTLKRKEKSEKKMLASMEVFEHYRKLLKSNNQHAAVCAIGWFRAVCGIMEPYLHFKLGSLRVQFVPIPSHWRFHATDLTKNHHPE